MNFSDFKLNRQLLDAVAEAGYTEPTPIQIKAIPAVLGGQDIMGVAQTGTGKTAAYLLPLLMKIKFAQGKNLRALILAPTRELAMQIDQAIAQLAKYTDIRHAVAYGGVGMKAQLNKVKEGIDILTATPGRFMDLYRTNEMPVKELKTLVLDEADKMMDMGFMPQIRQILEVIPTKRQNLLFSATMPEKVLILSEEFLEYPTIVEVAPSATTADTVQQLIYEVPNLKTKMNLLLQLLQDETRFNRVLIFARTRTIANNIFKYLTRKFAEETIRVIHANKAQNARINAMEAFKAGEVRIMVATDVVSRGIDVSLVSHVINFDVPLIYEDYVHRIGRTGRALQTGEAITFVTIAEKYHVGKIESIIRQTIPIADLPADLDITETPFVESQAMLREIDDQRKIADPTFKGAFHEKKSVPAKKKRKPRPKVDPRSRAWKLKRKR